MSKRRNSTKTWLLVFLVVLVAVLISILFPIARETVRLRSVAQVVNFEKAGINFPNKIVEWNDTDWRCRPDALIENQTYCPINEYVYYGSNDDLETTLNKIKAEFAQKGWVTKEEDKTKWMLENEEITLFRIYDKVKGSAEKKNRYKVIAIVWVMSKGQFDKENIFEFAPSYKELFQNYPYIIALEFDHRSVDY